MKAGGLPAPEECQPNGTYAFTNAQASAGFIYNFSAVVIAFVYQTQDAAEDRGGTEAEAQVLQTMHMLPAVKQQLVLDNLKDMRQEHGSRQAGSG